MYNMVRGNIDHLLGSPPLMATLEACVSLCFMGFFGNTVLYHLVQVNTNSLARTAAQIQKMNMYF